MASRGLTAALAAVVLGGVGAIAPTPASAVGFTVNSNLDTVDAAPGNGVCATAGGVCTLRAAVMEANALPGSDVITVPAMTITLGQELLINSNVEVRGAGARQTILTATPGHRNVYINGGTVRISDLAIQDIATTFGYGSGIQQDNGNVTLSGIRVANITVTSPGKAWGPVLAANGTMAIRDSEISGNTVSGTNDYVYGAGVTTGNGVGQSANVSITNTTIAGNTATSTGSGWVIGGGVYAGVNHTVEIASSTIAGNSVANGFYGVGGNLLQHSGGTGSMLVKDSVVAGGVDSAAAGGNCYPVGSASSKAVSFTGKNIVDDATCGAASAQRVIADPALRVLGNYGGPTNTRPPAAGSPALNAASDCASPADQRGQSRPVAGACDLGAAELGADLSTSVALSNPTPGPGGDFLATVQVSNAGLDTTTGTTATLAVTGGQLLSASPQSGNCATSASGATCALPEIAQGAGVQIQVAIRAPQSGAAAVQASVQAQQPDPQPGNNTAAAQAVVAAAGGSGGSGGDPGTGSLLAPACSNVITGTAKANRLTGTAGGDKINGRGGNDRLKGLAGVDCLTGSGGNDLLVPGGGADRVSAGPGRDTVKAKDGNRDRITCGSGRDRVYADRKDKVAKDCEIVRR